MISIRGSARRSYAFPAPLGEAFRFNADLDRMLALLPHIALVGAPDRRTRRLCYSAIESHLYKVHVYCTVKIDVDERAHRIDIEPTDDPEPGVAGFRSTRGSGRYASTIRFRRDGSATRIDYAIEIAATLPTPAALRVLPDAFVKVRAQRVFHARLDEILEEFVRRSIAAYREEAATRRSGSRTAPGSNGRRA